VVENAQQAGEQKLVISLQTLVCEPQSVLKGVRMKELPDPLRDLMISVPWARMCSDKPLHQLLVRRP
jgi:hypothetical protein